MPTSESLTVINPFTGNIDRTYPYDTPQSLTTTVQQLKQSQNHWCTQPLQHRIHRVRQALSYFEQHQATIADDICRQMGRPKHQAMGEINGLLERGHHLCEIAAQTLTPEPLPDKPGFKRSIHHAPYGLIYVISAWNYPLLITINSVVPALIAGNSVLLKHASQTTEIGRHFERAFADLAQTPLIKSVVIPHALSEPLIREGQVDHVIFTGSVPGGRTILSQCADSLIAPNLELGGKDGVYVDASADLNQAVETIVDGACYNAGQSCCGIERAYVHASLYDAFLSAAQTTMEHYQLGDPQSADTSMGPLAIAKNAQLMSDQVTGAIDAGARCLTGGKPITIGQGTFFEPTLLADVPKSSAVLKEENFGPILAVVPVADITEAITEINATDFGLTAAIFTQDQSQADHFFESVQAGTIFMNRCDYLDPALPWTGFKHSGCGSALSHYGFYSVTQRKSKHFRITQ